MHCTNTRPSKPTWRSPRWLKTALFGATLALGISANAQITYTQAFNGCNATACSGWTIAGGYSPNITATAGEGYSPCTTSNPAAKSNIYSSATSCTLTSTTSLGTSSGAVATFGFSYRMTNYPAASGNTASN